MQQSLDLSMCIEDYEGFIWPERKFDTTMEKNVFSLRKVPIGQLKPNEIRLLLDQGVGEEIILPLALDILKSDPLVETEYYSGDLLVSVSNLELIMFNDIYMPELKVIASRAMEIGLEECPDRLIPDLVEWCGKIINM